MLILWSKIKINNQNKNINNIIPTTTPIINNKIDNLISPTTTIIKQNIFGGKTKEDILKMETEEMDIFVSNLNREEIEELDLTPDYNFSDFLPEKKDTFIRFICIYLIFNA